MEPRKPGKPENYSKKQLKELLFEYRKKNKGTISFLGLEKETGISRKTWKRRMGEVIEELNQIVTLQKVTINDAELPLPNIDLIFDKFSNNPQGLRDALFHLNEVISKIYNDNINLQKTLEEKNKIEKALTKKVEKLEKDNNKLSNEVAHYEKMIIESMNPSMRKRMGIKNNLIEINKDNRESAASLEIEEEFPELFGDIDTK